MEDFTQLSDEELEAIAGAEQEDFSSLSDEELQALASMDDSAGGGGMISQKDLYETVGLGDPTGLLERGGGLLQTAVDAIDSVAGAPTRSAIYELQESGSLGEAGDAYLRQFGTTEGAPSGRDIAEKAGFEGDTAGWLGFGVDMAADPLMLPAPMLKGALSLGPKALGKTVALTDKGLRFVPLAGKPYGVASDLVQSGAKGAKNIKEYVFSGKFAPDYEILKSKAAEIGIGEELLPDTIKYGADTFLGKASVAKMENVAGFGMLNRYKNGLSKIRAAFDDRLRQFSRSEILDPIRAGENIREGAEKGIKSFWQNHKIRHTQIVEMAPDLRVPEKALAGVELKLGELQKWALGKAGSDNDKLVAQAEHILRATHNLDRRLAAGDISYSQLYDNLRNIADATFDRYTIRDTMYSPDYKKLREIYFTLDDALIKTVRSEISPKIAEELKRSNKAITQYFKDDKVIGRFIRDDKVSPEKLFQTLVKNGDSRKIKALRNIMDEQSFNALKGAFVDSLKRTAADEWGFQSMQSALRNKLGPASELFTPTELKELDEILELGKAWGPEKLSSANTSQGNIFASLKNSLFNVMANDSIVNMAKKQAMEQYRPSSKVYGAMEYVMEKVPYVAMKVVGYHEQENEPVQGQMAWKIKGVQNLLKVKEAPALLNDPEVVNTAFDTPKGAKILFSASQLSSLEAMKKQLERLRRLSGKEKPKRRKRVEN